MPILATTNSQTREIIPSGNYAARCYKMIQIGTVNEVIQGENKQLHKVRIGWEFPNDLKVFNEEKGEQPIVFDEEYTLSLHEKSTLRKMLSSWRGKDFTPDEAKSFDITVLIGKGCMVNIIHQVSKKGTTYAKIGSVSGLPKGVVLPDAINQPFILSYDNFDIDKFNSLPDFIKDKMKGSLEYAAMKIKSEFASKSTHEDGLSAPMRDNRGDVITGAFEDDLPF